MGPPGQYDIGAGLLASFSFYNDLLACQAQGKRPSVVCLQRTPHRLTVPKLKASDQRAKRLGRRCKAWSSSSSLPRLPQSTMRPWPRRPYARVCVRSKSKLDGSWELLPFLACYYLGFLFTLRLSARSCQRLGLLRVRVRSCGSEAEAEEHWYVSAVQPPKAFGWLVNFLFGDR